MEDSFQALGTLPSLIDRLNNCSYNKGGNTCCCMFNILAEILSGPLDLETSRLRSTSNTESSSQRSSTGWSSERSTFLSVTSSRWALRELKHLEKNRLSMSAFCELVWAPLPSSSIREAGCKENSFITSLLNYKALLWGSPVKLISLMIPSLSLLATSITEYYGHGMLQLLASNKSCIDKSTVCLSNMRPPPPCTY